VSMEKLFVNNLALPLGTKSGGYLDIGWCSEVATPKLVSTSRMAEIARDFHLLADLRNPPHR
jgi:hypothetical protein